MSEDLTHELFDLQDKVAVITGGGGVLCGTLSRALGKAGAKVAVLDIITDAAEKVAQSIVTDGGEAIAVRCNVLDKASIESARDTVL